MARPITFLSDYGYGDEFAGVCRAVIARIAPDARVIDLTHGIPRHAVRQGAVVLANALPLRRAGRPPRGRRPRRRVRAPAGRGPRARTTSGSWSAPTTACSAPALERFGGAAEAVDLTPLAVPARAGVGDLPRPRPLRPGGGAARRRRRRSPTPGEAIDPASLTRARAARAARRRGPRRRPRRLRRPLRQRRPQPRPRRPRPRPSCASATGSRSTPAATALTRALRAHLRRRRPRAAARSTRTRPARLALAVNRGSAAEVLGLAADDEVTCRRREPRSSFGAPHRHLPALRLDQRPRRASSPRRALPSGTVVTAGRADRRPRAARAGRWTAPAGKALLYSAILRPLERRHALLPLAVPLAVCEAVEALAPVACRVKWPNDVWIEERKCAGVLIEARPQDGWAVIGVGAQRRDRARRVPRRPARARDLGRRRGHRRAPRSPRSTTRSRAGSAAEAERGARRVPPTATPCAGREIAWAGAGDGRRRADGVDERRQPAGRAAGGRAAQPSAPARSTSRPSG